MTIITANIDIEDLAYEISKQNGMEDIMAHIILMDALVADYDFTATLVKKLQKSLQKEDECANGTGAK